PESLRSILVPVAATTPISEVTAEGSGAGTSAAAMPGSPAPMGGGMAGMGGAPAAGAGSMQASPAAPPGRSEAPGLVELSGRFRQPGAAVQLGVLADVQVVTGPPMIKDENGVLVGYVFADIDLSARDLGGWVNDAKE